MKRNLLNAVVLLAIVCLTSFYLWSMQNKGTQSQEGSAAPVTINEGNATQERIYEENTPPITLNEGNATQELIFDGKAHEIRVTFNSNKLVGTFLDKYDITYEQVKEVMWIAPYSVPMPSGTNIGSWDNCTYRVPMQKDENGNMYAVFHNYIYGNPIRNTGIGQVVVRFVHPMINQGKLSSTIIDQYRWKLVGVNGGNGVYYSTPDRPTENTLMMDLTGKLDLEMYRDKRPENHYKGAKTPA